jgi:hypothetical protein
MRGVKLGKSKAGWKKDMPDPKDLEVLSKLPKKVAVGQYYQVKAQPQKSSNNEVRIWDADWSLSRL